MCTVALKPLWFSGHVLLGVLLQVVMVPDPNLDQTLLGKATQQLSSLQDFDPTQWGLPPFDS